MIGGLYVRLVDALAALAGALILFVMLSVSADVVARYLLGRPIGWVLEANEYVLLAIPFLGMAWLARRTDGHVRIDLVVNVLAPGARQVLDLVTIAVTALTCAAAAYWAVVTTWDQYVRDIHTVGIYPIPKYLPVGVIGLGFTLTAIEFLRQARDRFQRLWRGRANGGPGAPTPPGRDQP